MRPLLALAAAASSTAVLVHGGVGGRWMRAQLAAVELPPSALFGDADVGRRVFVVTWHAVTAAFAVNAGALWLLAFGDAAARELLRLLCALHVALLLVGLVVMLDRPRAWLRPVPPVFALCMTTVAVATGLASR